MRFGSNDARSWHAAPLWLLPQVRPLWRLRLEELSLTISQLVRSLSRALAARNRCR